MAIFRLIKIFAAFVVFFAVLQKGLFILLYAPETTFGQWLDVLRHGLSMDLSMAAYLCVVPLLCALARTWLRGKALSVAMKVEKVYLVAVSVLLALVTVSDLALYRYWHFRLDMTPLFYLSTSPSAAMASAGVAETALAAVAVLAGAWLLSKALLWAAKTSKHSPRRVLDTMLLVLTAPLLVLAMRGGLTVSTMNPGHAYFSDNALLNHAAINPAFNLMYSASHQADFGKQYRFMDDNAAGAALSALRDAATDTTVCTIAPDSLLRCSDPDVYLIILESFSAHLMPSLGGDSVAMRLDSIAREGLLFSNFYASSFRTDRALPAILSGLPAQPSTSVMKFVDKASRLPSVARTLQREGYDTRYYYGGDLNFTNMNGYLVNAGFTDIIGDTSFPHSLRSGKWGVADHPVFERALKEMPTDSAAPRFTVIQTSSSHEPFEVPFQSARFASDKRLNAFAYTDSCVGAWYDSLKASPGWNRTLVVMVPDHQGCWPTDITDPASRHHVPLIIAGGALGASPAIIDTPGSQPDIAATLLGMLGIDSDEFTFSHNLLDPHQPHYAVFSEPALAGIVTARDSAVVNTDNGNAAPGSHPALAEAVKAYIMKLYDYLEQL